MPRDLDLRKLQAFGSDIVDIQAQAPDRVFVALAEGKIMVLDRLLVKHVLRCAHSILQSVSGTALHKQKMFVLPHASSIRCNIVCSVYFMGTRARMHMCMFRHAVFQFMGRRQFVARCNASARCKRIGQARQQPAFSNCSRSHQQFHCRW